MAFPAVLALLAVTGGPVAAHDAASGEKPSAVAVCTGCHGENGIGVSDELPALGGQHERYLRHRLKHFSRANSGSEIMPVIVSSLTEAQLGEVAAYFAGLPYLRKKQVVDAEKAARGEDAYILLCQYCHSSEGRGSAYAEYPLLAGQNLAYLQKAMADILAGRRAVDIVKKSLLSFLESSPERIDEALHFFASQEVDPASMRGFSRLPPKARRRSGAAP